MRDVVVGNRYATEVTAGLPIPSAVIHRAKVALGLASQRVLISAVNSDVAKKYMVEKGCSVAWSYIDFYATIRPARTMFIGEQIDNGVGGLPLYYIDELRLVDPQACVKKQRLLQS